MRKLLAPILAVLVLAVPASASVPTPAQLAWARAKAVSYWHAQNPPCGPLTVLAVPLPMNTDGQANYETCAIELNSHTNLRGYPWEMCVIYVHEFGHLVLGTEYFAASNPSDPAHSSDPDNIMYGGIGATGQQQERQAIASGCLAPRRNLPY